MTDRETYRAKADEYTALKQQIETDELTGEALAEAKRRMALLTSELYELKNQLGLSRADLRRDQRQRKKGDNNTYVGAYTPEYIAHCQNSDIYMWKHKILRERLLQQYYRTEGVKRGFAKGVLSFEEKYNVNVIGKKEDEKILDFLSRFDNLLDVPVCIRTKDGRLIWESENANRTA